MTTEVSRKNIIDHAIDQTLIDFFETRIGEAKKIDQYYATLWQTLYDLHKSGGKRLRPKILIMAYDAFGGKDSISIVPIACAQELLHFSMLIHDDIIDRDKTRYGVDNMNGTYEKSYNSFVPESSDLTHYANSAAIMAGDLMLVSVYKLIADSELEDSEKLMTQRIMYQSMFDVAGGELLDTESSFRPLGAIDSLTIAQFKTASYSFLGPLLIGASLAHANDNQKQLLRKFAINLGIAYQLTDDLLGLFGDPTKTGKSNSSDIREGKKTYTIETAVEKLSSSQQKVFNRHFGKQNATDADVATIRNLIEECGAKEETERKIDQYSKTAAEALTSLQLTDAAYKQFNDLIQTATKRFF